MLNRPLRAALLATTFIAGLSFASTSALAQEQPAGDEPGVQSQADALPNPEDSSGDIVVTGTLIRNPNLVASSPVTVVGQDEIDLQQANTAEEVLRDVPGVVANVGSQVNSNHPGNARLDLRGLGSLRNLVLLDGTRIVPADLGGRVDLNIIPLALIQRVDVLTGGATTTYGADAVSGVANFITRRNFSGAELNVGSQITQRGDGSTFRADLTLGANFDDGRGNAVFSIGYQKARPVSQGARDFSRVAIDSFTGDPAGQFVTVPLIIAGAFQVDLNSGALVDPYALFNHQPYNLFQTPFERFNMYGAAHYEVADGIEVYAQGLFSKTSVGIQLAPSGAFGTILRIPISNPFIPTAARNQLCALVFGAGPTRCAEFAAATSPSDPNYRTFEADYYRRAVEAGPRASDYDTTVFNVRAGLRGQITDSIEWDVWGAYGESENIGEHTGLFLRSRLQQALLATNPNSCLDPSNGCVPINLFGPVGSLTPAMLAFTSGITASSTTFTSLGQARGVISGDLGWSSPLASTPISFAVGAEYRDYGAGQKSDSVASIPGELVGTTGFGDDLTGSYNVYEGFAELIAPLVTDRPFFHALTLEAGVRHSNYSSVGTSTTWKVGGSWEPVASLKFRGNYQKAVRAPNIAELFTPVTTIVGNLSADPCQGSAPLSNADLRAVCLAQGAPASSIGTIPAPPGSQVNVTIGGNPNLDVEKATTWTVGAVLQPSFLRGLSLSVDYYSIKIRDAISTPTVSEAVGSCFNTLTAASATDPRCTGIRRNPASGSLFGDPGLIAGVPTFFSNLGRISTDGVDLNVNYRRDLGFAELSLAFSGNYTAHSRFQSSPASLERECTGFYSTNCSILNQSIHPKYSFNQRTTLGFGPIDVSLLWRYIHKVRYEPRSYEERLAVVKANPAICGADLNPDVNDCIIDSAFQRIGSRHYFDLSVSEAAIAGTIPFQLEPRQNRILFQNGGRVFALDLASRRIAAVADDEIAAKLARQQAVASPDGKYVLLPQAGSFTLVDGTGRKIVEQKGEKHYGWQVPPASWSPDGRYALAMRTDQRHLHKTPVVTYNALETVNMVPSTRVGEPIARTELHLIDATTGEVKRLPDVAGEGYNWIAGWRPDGREALVLHLSRDAKRLDLIGYDPATAASRLILREERPESFVAAGDFAGLLSQRQVKPLDDRRFLWMSERDGWRHVYLYDWSGKFERQVTRGKYVVEQVLGTAPGGKALFVVASADGPRPYDRNLYRVPLTGGAMTRISTQPGDHQISLSPDGRYYTDGYSTLTEPRRAAVGATSGGTAIQYSAADVSQLATLPYMQPEPFTARAADGETILHGIIYKPWDFDPSKRYPLINWVYAGPSSIMVPRSLTGALSAQWQTTAQMGFVVVVVDARGTPGRSKAFQDANYGRIGQVEIRDQVAAVRQAAASRPYMDLDRVGIFGHSWGGYYSTRGILTEPDFYKAGYSSSQGMLDGGANINEPHLGLVSQNPQGYEAGANDRLAGNLKGAYKMSHGTNDTAVPLAATMRMADALIKANKQFDLLIMPGGPHTPQPPLDRYWFEDQMRFFIRHLGGPR